MYRSNNFSAHSVPDAAGYSGTSIGTEPTNVLQFHNEEDDDTTELQLFEVVRVYLDALNTDDDPTETIFVASCCIQSAIEKASQYLDDSPTFRVVAIEDLNQEVIV